MVVKCDECIISFSIPVTDGPVPCPNCRIPMKKGADLAHSDNSDTKSWFKRVMLRPIEVKKGK